MHPLPKPSEVPVEVFLQCVEGVRDLAVRARFQRVAPDIRVAAEAFEAAALAGVLHTLEEQRDVAGLVTREEMSELYESRMARSGSRGRALYDKLMVLVSTCPLCGHRTVSCLDHHLPRSKFPALAVTPSNLVPACGDCNKRKLDASPSTAEEQTFHPYFDNFGQQPWLHAEVIEHTPPTLRFSVRPPASWPALWGARARYHFKLFQLGRLYTAQAAQELVNLRHYLVWLLESAGATEVRRHLKEHAASREKNNPNSWQAAMYRALSASDWFCTEGLTKLPSSDA
jgi:hypothetical protein